MQLPAPAKINLFLRVSKRRPDGYHNLCSLFERISLFDTLIFKRKNAGIHLKVQGMAVSAGPDNLVMKAAHLLQRKYAVRQGAEITLIKRVPVSAGLGGGSSNAATTLIGLNRLWKLGISRKRLADLSAEIGSDIPFFVYESAYALVSGRGEVIQPLKRRTKLWHCIVKPDFGISTREAYAAFDKAGLGLSDGQLTLQKADVKILFRLLQNSDSEHLPSLLTNSLEHALNKRVKSIFEIKKSLVQNGAFCALLSGSGSAVFGLFKTRARAQRAAERLAAVNTRWQAHVAHTFNGKRVEALG